MRPLNVVRAAAYRAPLLSSTMVVIGAPNGAGSVTQW